MRRRRRKDLVAIFTQSFVSDHYIIIIIENIKIFNLGTLYIWTVNHLKYIFFIWIFYWVLFFSFASFFCLPGIFRFPFKPRHGVWTINNFDHVPFFFFLNSHPFHNLVFFAFHWTILVWFCKVISDKFWNGIWNHEHTR